MNNASSPYRHTMATATSILAWILAAAAMLMLASCQMHAFGDPDDDGDDDIDTTRTVIVTFNLHMNDNVAVTRADGTIAASDTTWHDDYNREKDESAIESAIDPTRLNVYFYEGTGDGTFIIKVGNLTAVETTAGADGTKTYWVRGSMVVPQNLLSRLQGKVKVAVFANMDMPEGSETYSLKDLADRVSYNYTPFINKAAGATNAYFSTRQQFIPMFGFHTYENLTFKAGALTTLTDIDMLRAMAKVKVYLSDDLIGKGYKIEAVRFNAYNKTGYGMPKGEYVTVDNNASPAKTYGQTTDLKVIGESFHPWADVTTANPDGDTRYNAIEFSDAVTTTDAVSGLTTTGKTTVSKPLYLPEYDNTTAGTTTATITVVLGIYEDGQLKGTRTVTFDFAEYTDDGTKKGAVQGSNMDIVRNHFYKFHLYGSQLRVHLSVEPWTVIEHPEITL